MLLFVLNAVSHLIYNVFLVLHVQCFLKLIPWFKLMRKMANCGFIVTT